MWPARLARSAPAGPDCTETGHGRGNERRLTPDPTPPHLVPAGPHLQGVDAGPDVIVSFLTEGRQHPRVSPHALPQGDLGEESCWRARWYAPSFGGYQGSMGRGRETARTRSHPQPCPEPRCSLGSTDLLESLHQPRGQRRREVEQERLLFQLPQGRCEPEERQQGQGPRSWHLSPGYRDRPGPSLQAPGPLLTVAPTRALTGHCKCR